ncbi:hypothetical protein CK203_056924 [Vitis vinifera]|uniref:Uncharacterized protein n=1 Tax=Vitis vinifera TaxID=29760 RepID=A0A438FUL6_VITVI|nr:hypothetical protein CK203_056924 [Vitis vinifera]
MGDFLETEIHQCSTQSKNDSVENTLNKMMDGMQNDLSQKIDNLQYSVSRLTNLNTVQEKGRFPSQPHQNPKGIHEVELMRENLHRNGLMQLTFGNMTLELISSICPRSQSIRKKKKVQKRRIEEILPLFNEEEAQEAVKDEAPKLSLNPLPTELKYAYLEENKKCPVIISSSLTIP